MEAKYVDRLVNQVKYAGFGESKEMEIRSRMANNEPSFSVLYQPDFDKNCQATANIRRSEKGDYFFNNYDVLVNREGAEPLKQTFYVDKAQQDKDGQWLNSNISLKEGYNMLEGGRAVLKEYLTKEQERYQAWTMLDFKNTDQHGNFKIIKKTDFDLVAKLSEHNLKELADPEKKLQLIESLQKGNRQQATRQFNGKEEKISIEANPRFKTIKIFAANGRVAQHQSEDKGQSENQTNTEKLKEDNARNSQGRSAKRGQGIS